MLSGLAFAAANATWEEYTLRGFPLSALGKVLGANSGVWVTAAVFSLLHLMNPNWSASMLSETLLAGVLLGYAVLAGRSILFAIGIHTGWNLAGSFFQSSRWWASPGQPATSSQLGIIALAAFVLFALAHRGKTSPGAPASLTL